MNGFKQFNAIAEKIAQAQKKPAIASVTPWNHWTYRWGLRLMAVAEQERVLVFQNRQLARILMPGQYRFFDFKGQLAFEVYEVTTPAFQHVHANLWWKQHAALMAAHFMRVDLTEAQVGLVYQDNRLCSVLAPGTQQFYWRAVAEIRVETLDIWENYQVPADKLALLAYSRLLSSTELAQMIAMAEIKDKHAGLLLVNGKFERLLTPGLYGFWRFNRSVMVEVMDLRPILLEVQGQEILTKDKVSLRINLSAVYHLIDPVMAYTELKSAQEFLYKELQFGLREIIGTKTLDELLANKDDIHATAFQMAIERAARYGISIDTIGIKDVILPGEMKTLLNQVVEAEKAAQANLIKRREETAATRSLLNTAKMMEDNPVVLRLKELEVLEKMADKIDRFTVLGGLDSLLKDMVKIKLS